VAVTALLPPLAYFSVDDDLDRAEAHIHFLLVFVATKATPPRDQNFSRFTTSPTCLPLAEPSAPHNSYILEFFQRNTPNARAHIPVRKTGRALK